MALPRLRPVALSLLFAFSAAQAQENTLSAVNVTAKGYSTSDLETPLSTVALDRDEIIRRGAANVGDALRGEPGIAISNDSAQGQNPIIRGLGKESIVLLVDGMRFNSAQPAGAIASFMSLGTGRAPRGGQGRYLRCSTAPARWAARSMCCCRRRASFPASALKPAPATTAPARAMRGTAVVNASSGDHAVMLGASLARIDDYKSPEGTVPRTGYDSDAFIGQYRFRIDAQQQLRLSLQQHKDEDVWYPGSTRPQRHPQSQQHHRPFAATGTPPGRTRLQPQRYGRGAAQSGCAGLSAGNGALDLLLGQRPEPRHRHHRR
jgi:hemoglobin/transferrin/lactoferrin receptor protein